jgi:hypothetical protein
LLGYFSFVERDQLTRRLDKLEHAASATRNAQDPPSRVAPVSVVQRMSLPQTPAVPAADQAPPPDASSEAAGDPGPTKEQFDSELNDYFARLPRATSRSTTTQAALTEALGKLHLEGTTILPSIECHDAVCRADFAKLDETQGRNLIGQMRSIGWDGPLTAYIATDERGERSVRVFVAARGAQLPMPH